jgi:D-alanyl-D-alanine carboxypeptidase
LGPVSPVWAADAGRHAVLVIDANTGRVLHERSAGALRHPASLVKLMTLFLIFEQIEEGRLSFSSKVRFSANAVAQPPSKLDVEEGTEIDLIDAIKALIVKSANDVAVALAERVGGSEEAFVALMNRKARELGMSQTQFRNASGLPDAAQVTTARDMVTLALGLYDRFPKHYPLFATRTFTWGGETHRNHNTLLFRYPGLDGMKTGYIRMSGFNLVASARRGKKHVLAAYFGGKTAAARNAAVRSHLDAGFLKAAATKTRQPGPLVVAQAKAPPAAEPARAAQPAIDRAQASAPEPKAPPVATAEAPAPQPVQRPALASATGVEVVRVRPVLAEGAAPAPETPARPASIEDLLKHPEPPSVPQPQDATSAPAAKLAAAPGPAGPAISPFQVQVGAYETEAEAERQLALVRERAGAVVGRHVPHMSQVKRGDKVFFRARYVGFDARSAADSACSELKRLEIDCLVMKAE